MRTHMARIQSLDITQASKHKQEQWAKLRTEELENLYASMSEQLRLVPDEKMSAWDKHNIKLIGDIIGERRAGEIRRDIMRMMELAGLHYGIAQTLFKRRQAYKQGT